MTAPPSCLRASGRALAGSRRAGELWTCPARTSHRQPGRCPTQADEPSTANTIRGDWRKVQDPSRWAIPLHLKGQRPRTSVGPARRVALHRRPVQQAHHFLDRLVQPGNGHPFRTPGEHEMLAVPAHDGGHHPSRRHILPRRCPALSRQRAKFREFCGAHQRCGMPGQLQLTQWRGYSRRP